MIRRLDRHVLTRFLSALALVTAVCVLLFTVLDFSSRAAAFVREKFPPIRVLQFYSYYVPEVLVMLMPVIVILAVAWSIGRLARDNEITAMRACGVGPARIGAPVFITCAVLAAAVFVVNERVVTKTHAYIREERLLLRRKPPREILPAQYFYTDEKRGKLYFEKYDVKNKVMHEVRWGRPLRKDSPEIQIFADRAEWLGGHWWLFNVQITRIDRFKNEELSPLSDKRIMYGWKLPPEYITGQKGPQEMTLGELARAIRRDRDLQHERAIEYSLQGHLRVALPILTLLVFLLSFPFVVKLGTGGRRAAAGLGVGLLLCFAYYLFYGVMAAIVRKWVPFPPLVWVPNLAYGAAGAIMFLRMG